MKTITLTKPIHYTRDGKQVAVRDLTLDEPTMGNIEDMERGATDTHKLRLLVASMTGLPSDALKELSWADVRALNDAVMEYLGKSQETGEIASQT